jgi:outer membrane protein OmpA-like peptidoglycan-associated protein
MFQKSAGLALICILAFSLLISGCASESAKEPPKAPKDFGLAAALWTACHECNLESVRWMIEADANVNAALGDNLTTPLMETVRSYDNKCPAEIVAMLVEAGAEINKQDINGNTALHYAAKYNCGQFHWDAVKTLLENGADPVILNKLNQTPLELATQVYCPEKIEIITEYINAKKDSAMVVLLPEPDGKVGKLEVKNPQGTQLLDKPKTVVSVDDVGRPPQKPKAISDAEIDRIFGSALKARPQQPVYYTLYFKTGTTELSATSKMVVPQILQSVKKREPADVSIVGHADTKGTKAYNIRLSTRRAQIVADFLKNAGLNLRNVEITSHGEAFPVVQTGDGVDEPLNRRVEVTIR